MAFSQVLATRQRILNKYRRALRAEDQRAFDALFEQARLHSQAGAYSAGPDPEDSFLLSILIENWKSVERLEARVRELDRNIELLRADVEARALLHPAQEGEVRVARLEALAAAIKRWLADPRYFTEQFVIEALRQLDQP